jgi:signal transduction histidine kinase
MAPTSAVVVPLRLRIGVPGARSPGAGTERRPARPPMMRRPGRLWAHLAVGGAVAAVLVTLETLLGYLLRHAAPPEPLSAAYLLGVVVVSAGWGVWLGLATAVASALAFDYFHFPPVGSIGIYYSGEWLVMPIFLVVAVLVAGLSHVARSRATEAGERHREAERAADQAHALVEEQAALHRVATLTAREAAPHEVFTAVCREVGNVLAARYTALGRFEPDATVTVVGSWSETRRNDLPRVGSRWPMTTETLVELVSRSGQPERTDGSGYGGHLAPFPHGPDVPSAVGCPIVVDGRVWGVMLCGFATSQPDRTEARMRQFTRLSATAIANAEHRGELADARARVVAAVDDTRRRIERDLHDGVQQSLFALALRVSAAQHARTGTQQLTEHLSEIDRLLSGLVRDLRQISRGLRPVLLSEDGLGPVLRTLAHRCTVPVDLDVRLDRRLPDRVEATVYYIVSEALTNATKHAHATELRIELNTVGASLRLSIRDNGIGGADPGRGSGLVGLRERAEALGGHLDVDSPLGHGTSMLVTLPTDDALTCRGRPGRRSGGRFRRLPRWRPAVGSRGAAPGTARTLAVFRAGGQRRRRRRSPSNCPRRSTAAVARVPAPGAG